MPLKTLHLTNSWHETSGGIATFYRALIDEANKRNCEIRLVVPGAADGVEGAGRFGKIYYIQAPPALFNPNYRMIYPSQFLLAESKLQKIVSMERPDLVEICDKYTLNYFGALLRMRLASQLNFRPLVLGLSCERMDDNFRSYIGRVPLWRRFCSWYVKWAYFPFFDHHIANSSYTAGELQAATRGHVVPRGIWIRPMGVDLSCLTPQRRSPEQRCALMQTMGASANSILLLYAGRLAPEKNLPLLFSLMKLLACDSKHDFRLLVAGDGIERERWERECAQRLPRRVTFVGHIRDRNRLADLYANSDFFIHPNPREPFGIAPLEAMASGLPLIAPNTGGVTSYANAENAWTVEPNPQDFAAAIAQALTDHRTRQRKIICAVNQAQEYGWSKVAASFFDLYTELYNAAQHKQAVRLPPAFTSTPPTVLQKAMIDFVSQAAQWALEIVASLSRRTTAPQGRAEARELQQSVRDG